jgi:hypothetical protein
MKNMKTGPNHLQLPLSAEEIGVLIDHGAHGDGRPGKGIAQISNSVPSMYKVCKFFALPLISSWQTLLERY